ncbi:MAG: SLBB domain-containing protein [Pseudomonadota bacterium]
MLKLCRIILIVVLGAGAAGESVAQVPGLNSEQQALLNQLPPAQRQQAMDAIRQLQSGAATAPAPSTTLVEPITQMPEGESEFLPDELRPVRAGPGSQVVLTIRQKQNLSDAEQQDLYRYPSLLDIEGVNYYVLDESGRLELPGLEPISLAGLTQEEIETRLAAVPEFLAFSVTASLLGDGESVTTQLRPFGYDFFKAGSAGFDPVTTGPAPPDYVLGPGDSIRVQLFGNVNAIYEYEVTREGQFSLPELGPINVAGLTFSEFRADLRRKVQESLIGTQASVTIGGLRSIRVFVLGDVNRPGSYVLGSLSTISSALYSSGGISTVGSLRNVQLKRKGEVVTTLDLYALLLAGDSSDDVRLQPGDVVFVPPVGPQVSIDGAVKRPAVYEVAPGTSFREAVGLAGGFDADAYSAGSRVERISAGGARRILDVALDSSSGQALEVRAGDFLVVPRVLPDLEDTVVLSGHVKRPGPFQWREGLRLTDLLPTKNAALPGADTDYILIRREDGETGFVSTVSASLDDALSARASVENIVLEPKDTVYVFSASSGRQRVLAPLIDELELQSSIDEPLRVVSIVGQVRAPGEYPLEAGMDIAGLIAASGGLLEEAYFLKAEIARYDIVGGQFRDTRILDVDLAAILRGDSSAEIELQPHDNLKISVVPEWDRLWTVSLEGEVTFPGQYRIRDGESLNELLERAGGLTDEAFPEGAVFLRESLREREQEQIDLLARRLEADLTSLSLESADSGGQQTLDTGEELLNQLRDTSALGRLVIDLERSFNTDPGASSYADLELRDGDRLLIPKRAQEVTVIGEAQQNTSHLHENDVSLFEYIDKSGGFTRRADKKLIYVVRANGAVETGGSSRWFGRKNGIDIRPGDTIVVPMDTDRIRPLALWSSVTQILYQAAIAVAAVNTFDN